MKKTSYIYIRQNKDVVMEINIEVWHDEYSSLITHTILIITP